MEILLAGDREAGCCETGLDAGPECFEQAHGGVVECTQRLVLSVLVESTKIIDRLKSTSCNCQRSSSECRTPVTSSSQTMVPQSASMSKAAATRRPTSSVLGAFGLGLDAFGALMRSAGFSWIQRQR